LILGGTQDHAVPPASVRRLFEAARSPKSLWLLEGAGHGGYASVAGEEYKRRLIDFLRAGLT
jgi:uncharacterized protein